MLVSWCTVHMRCSCLFILTALGIFHSVNAGSNATFLSVVGKQFVLGGQTVFLSGANQAWVSYANDFGNHNYERSKWSLERYLRELHEAGGNSIRIWIHAGGEATPNFNEHGHVISLDKEGTFLNEMKDYLEKAEAYDILVFFCLWNGALVHPRLDTLISDPHKLQSYIDNALIPWVEAVKDYSSLGGWDILNEPEGMMVPNLSNPEPCFDTRSLHFSGAGWTRHYHTAWELQRFINWQADAIHRTDPKSLVTIGTWNPRSATDRMCQTDFYKDSCLVKAGQRSKGTLDFYQIHTYDNDKNYDVFSPFKLRACDYGHYKPIVVGEFNQVRGGGMDITDQFLHAYRNKYNGAWSWHADGSGTNSDTWRNQKRGIAALARLAEFHNLGRINISQIPAVS